MNRKKTQPKVKEPVRIRFKPLANGNYSIYLDTYFEGKRIYEFLRLYLIPETNRLAREQNRLTLQTANVMKAQRIIELANEHFSRRTPGVRPTLLREYLFYYIRSDAGGPIAETASRPDALTWRTTCAPSWAATMTC